MIKRFPFKTCVFRGLLLIIFIFSFPSCSAADSKVESDFYKGLIVKSDPEKIPDAVKLFENALESSNEYIRQAASAELAVLEFSGTELSAKTSKSIREEASGWWGAAFDAAKDFDREKALNFLLSLRQGEEASVEARLYVLREFEKQGELFSESEMAAIDGQFSIFISRYNDALRFFRTFQENSIWPQRIPQLFLEYPVLINDLGRAFQYTSTGIEGFSLFLQWERNLAGEMAFESTQTIADNIDIARYNLLFFAARIARRNGRNADANSLFEQALYLAPDSEQSDACAWYVLELSLNETPEFFFQQLEKIVPYWRNGNYFNDLLERFLQTLVSRQDWKGIIRIFNIIQESKASVKAGYAWVIARAIEEGYLSQEEKLLLLRSYSAEPHVFMQIAYDATENETTSLLYYRYLSAVFLEKPFLELSEENAASGEGKEISSALEFLLGFFAHNAVEYVNPFIAQMEQELATEDLRAIAGALEKEEMYSQSIRLVLRYINREDYTLVRRDMELLFPRAYAELVEEQAAASGIAPEIIFGLIRTESLFQSNVISSAGAIGLTQLMPDTALDMAGRIRRSGGPDFASWENGLDLGDPVQNIHIGVFYLNYLNERFENMMLSLLAYNGGMTRVRRWLSANSLPLDLFYETIAFYETRDYGRRVMSAAEVYRELYYQQ